jgi:hypothetical protein
VHVCKQLLLEKKKSMEVFVIAHYEMKQRKGERAREGGTHLRKGGREGPILHTWELD